MLCSLSIFRILGSKCGVKLILNISKTIGTVSGFKSNTLTLVVADDIVSIRWRVSDEPFDGTLIGCNEHD